ncbi:beta-ketoacyl-[acyl-carrier-protein] synthase family protein [Streptomyces lanatus]|uniref:3-oxoacyl-[acyl-carrier-protein] synthase 1 n=1 Tax=Streptomyces lanatus TaxID=66900 RepID=A0ABV1Y7T2_9ACTN|nr:beta-ketoacyl-[acyl-carrier-protein] synthase family protein [Streptomyces lanatus]GHH19680.1 3-oxoacyl-ACP synthase [Streptomyces lanatus]
MRRRVVITGLGPVSSIGTGVDAFADGLAKGMSGISPISSFDASGFPYRMAGEVPGFAPDELVHRLKIEEWGRSSLFAAAAGRLAVEDAGLDPEQLAGTSAGSCIGTTAGEASAIERLTEHEVESGFESWRAELATQVPSSRLAAAVNRELGLTGEAVTISTACSASNYALGYAYAAIASGDADHMIAGGAEGVYRWAHAGFYRLGAMAERHCSPFDRDREGMLTGEGGAALFLESLDSAERRGARVYAEVLGYGINCDAGHMVAPDSASIAECMRLAHKSAGITADQVDYICAHGTGTPANDAAETLAVREVFGDTPPPISSVKSMLGHTMGAASGFGAIACALGIARGFIPPTINFRTLDPDMPGIDPVPNEARPARLRVVQNNGFAFGGNNAITILGEVA